MLSLKRRLRVHLLFYRIGMFEGMIALGTILGTSSSSFILNAWGYVTLYAICTGCLILAWIYTYFLIPESIPVVESEVSTYKKHKISFYKNTNIFFRGDLGIYSTTHW